MWILPFLSIYLNSLYVYLSGEKNLLPNLKPYQFNGAIVMTSFDIACAKIGAQNEKVEAGIIAHFALIKYSKSFLIE